MHPHESVLIPLHQKNEERYWSFPPEAVAVPGSFSPAASCSRPRLFLGKGDSGSRVKEEEEEDEKESVPGPYSAVLRSSSERAKVRTSVGLERVEQFPVLVILIVHIFSSSVPDPPDPRVFWPPGSGSTSQRYGSGSGSGSGSFYHHAKIIRKNLESYYFVTLFDFLSLKNIVNVPSKSNKQNKFG
jgi:hypothetical protein